MCLIHPSDSEHYGSGLTKRPNRDCPRGVNIAIHSSGKFPLIRWRTIEAPPAYWICEDCQYAVDIISLITWVIFSRRELVVTKAIKMGSLICSSQKKHPRDELEGAFIFFTSSILIGKQCRLIWVRTGLNQISLCIRLLIVNDQSRISDDDDQQRGHRVRGLRVNLELERSLCQRWLQLSQLRRSCHQYRRCRRMIRRTRCRGCRQHQR